MIGVNNNSSANDAYNSYVKATGSISNSMANLSSGSKLNTANELEADLGISEQMQGQISGLAQAQQNSQDGISLVQTMGAGLGQVSSILQQVSDLAVQYNNGTYNAQDQAAITAQVAQLSAEIGQIQSDSQFNGINLFGNTATAPITLQSGADGGQTTTVNTVALGSLLGGAVANFATLAAGGGPASIAGIQGAIGQVAQSQGVLGGVEENLTDNVSQLSDYQENLMNANSQISDVDVAQESTNLAQSQILQQTSLAMMAQANQNAGSVLKLLG